MIFHNVNCASSYVIYFMECILCNKQYVGKAETTFNTRLNNHRKGQRNNGLQTFSKIKPQFQQPRNIYHYRSVNEHFQI